MQRVLTAVLGAMLCMVSGMTLADRYGVYEQTPYAFLIKKKVSRFSEIYAISPPAPGQTAYPNTYPGNVKKSAFRIRTNYDLSNQQGWQATGITRLLSLGTVYSWATDIDVYDTRGVKIGLIKGNIATLEPAKYNLYSYDEAGKATQVGVAMANADFMHFSITTPGNYLPIADLARNKEANNWTVTVIAPGIIDDRLIRIFAGFVVNYQDKFSASL